MAIPVEISYRNMESSDSIEHKVKRRMAHLELICGEINRAHLVLGFPHHHKHQGNHFQVRIELYVPGTELNATSNVGAPKAHENFYAALRNAFDAMEIQLKRWKEKRRLDVKAHSRPSAPVSINADDDHFES